MHSQEVGVFENRAVRNVNAVQDLAVDLGNHFILSLIFSKIVVCVTARIMRIYQYSIRNILVYVWIFTFD